MSKEMKITNMPDISWMVIGVYKEDGTVMIPSKYKWKHKKDAERFKKQNEDSNFAKQNPHIMFVVFEHREDMYYFIDKEIGK